jgi:hypothetical protein
MRRPYVVVSLSVLLVLILLAPNILMAQPVETERALSLDPKRASAIRTQFGGNLRSCTMCGQYCVFLLLEKYSRSGELSAEGPLNKLGGRAYGLI